MKGTRALVTRVSWLIWLIRGCGTSDMTTPLILQIQAAALDGSSFDNYIHWIAPAYLITLVSLPAATAPAGLSADGLPIVAPRFEEPLILRVARHIHRASKVGRPPISG
jgi:Asp-tRNA(Asn)/Glu-tRNA(Gln) amidotransferase A subunit family amidase